MRHLFCLIIINCFFTTFGLTAEYRSREQVQVAREDTVSGDLFVGARYLDVRGSIQGDVYAGCERIVIEGNVGDDCFASGKEIIIRGNVSGLVLGFGKTIVIDGIVEDDVLAFGKEVRVTDRARIQGNLFVGAGDLRIEGGIIKGWVKGGTGRAYFNGNIAGRVDFETAIISFGPDYKSGGVTKLKLSQKFKGKEIKNLPENVEITYKKGKWFFESFYFYWSFISTLVVGIIYVSFFRNFSRDQLTFTQEHAVQSLGVGSFLLVALPVVILILGILVLTIPVALILLVLYFTMLYLSSIFSGLFLGEYILSTARQNGSSKTLIWGLLLGLILLLLLAEIPFIGWLFSLAASIFGMGGFMLYLWHRYKRNGQQEQVA